VNQSQKGKKEKNWGREKRNYRKGKKKITGCPSAPGNRSIQREESRRSLLKNRGNREDNNRGRKNGTLGNLPMLDSGDWPNREGGGLSL